MEHGEEKGYRLTILKQTHSKSKVAYYGWPNLSRISEKMTHPAPPTTSERVSLPPGTNCGNFIPTDDELDEYLSDQDIAAGTIPNSTNTIKNMKQKEIC